MGLTYQMYVPKTESEDIASLCIGVPHSPGKEAHIYRCLMHARHQTREGFFLDILRWAASDSGAHNQYPIPMLLNVSTTMCCIPTYWLCGYTAHVVNTNYTVTYIPSVAHYTLPYSYLHLYCHGCRENRAPRHPSS